MNIKKEVIVPEKEVRKKNVEEDDESDDDRSVITLSSDSEVEREQKDDEDEDMEQDSEDDDSDKDDDDETDSDEDEEEEESDSEDESDSVWSTTDERGENEIITSEAIEARIIRKFERAIVLMADNQTDQAKEILQKLLKKPLISIHHKTDLDFEEIEEISRPSKILQIYVAIHKNLATLEPEKAVEHYLQVLCYKPNDSSIWLEVALRSVENGDLQFSLYAFKKCEDKKESFEAHATILYLVCNYSACLNLLKCYEEDVGELNDKMKYLKVKIRSTNNYYRKMCDDIFEEDDVYTDLKILDSKKVAVFDERFEELSKKIEEKREKMNMCLEEDKSMKIIDVEVSETQQLSDVLTIFCDLFDRIQSYSKLNYHPIRFKTWENRKDFLEIQESLDEIVEIVDCVENMTEQVSKKKNSKKSKAKYLSSWRTRLFVEEDNTEDEDDLESDGTKTESKRNTPEKEFELEENELAQEFGLICKNIQPINSKRQKERTPPISSISNVQHFDEDIFLEHIREYFFCSTVSRQYTIIEIIRKCLLKFSKFSGILKDDLKIVIREMYTRLGYFEDLRNSKYDQLNLILMEIDHGKGLEMCAKKYISYWYESDNEIDSDIEEQQKYENISEKQLYIRFLWKYSNTKLKDSIKLEYLYTLKSMMEEDKIYQNANEQFESFEIIKIIDELEKKQRIESIKLLWNSKNYQELVKICENDIDFSDIDQEEIEQILIFWLKSLERLKKFEKYVQLSIRVLHFYLFSSETIEKYEENIENLFKTLRKKVDFSKIDVETSSSLGYFVCVSLRKSKKIEENWRNWKLLHGIVRAMRDIPMIEYITTLDKNEDSDCLPSLDLDVLVKAHEVIGEAKMCCKNDNFDFMFFILARFREVIDDIPLLEALFEKEYTWIYSNLNNEITQILYCLFGKYAKKRKNAQDHGTKGNCRTDLKMANKVLRVILVQPLPLYDDKEKLGHDVIELINSKFDFLLETKPEKSKIVESFEEILKKSANWEIEQASEEFEEIKTFEESEIQALVWYSMALNSYKTSNHDDCKKFSQLYLTSVDSSHDDRLRSSAWAILAHEHVRQLFQLDKNGIFNEWKWRIQPFKMAIHSQSNESVLHFEIAATMYQLSSILTRFIRELPLDDIRRKRIKDANYLRNNSRYHFDKCLQLAQPSNDSTPPEYNWLCYFFIGKLAGKEKENEDIVKVVECFYEAACGCQLAGFYYPLKINTKKQTNFEPLEVHYQVHSAVWKYLDRTSNPPLNTLIQLEAYLKTFAFGHKIVRCSYSMFSTPPEIYLSVSEIIENVVENEKNDDDILEEIITKLELIEKLKEMCMNAFGLIVERFPHFKAHYRLAEGYLEKDRIDLASDHMMKNVFKGKKKDDGGFDNIVEIICSDINRAGSFCFHVERCLRMAIYINSQMSDIHNLSSLLTSLIYNITIDDDRFIEPHSNARIVISIVAEIEKICLAERPKSGRNTPSPQPHSISPTIKKKIHVTPTMIRNELWKIWTTLNKRKKQSESEKLLSYIEKRIDALITKVYGSIQNLKIKIQQIQDKQKETADHLPKKTKNILKRKPSTDVLKMLEPQLKKSALTVLSTPTVSTIVDDDDDIQCLDPPPIITPNQADHLLKDLFGQ